MRKVLLSLALAIGLCQSANADTITKTVIRTEVKGTIEGDITFSPSGTVSANCNPSALNCYVVETVTISKGNMTQKSIGDPTTLTTFNIDGSQGHIFQGGFISESQVQHADGVINYQLTLSDPQQIQ